MNIPAKVQGEAALDGDRHGLPARRRPAAAARPWRRPCTIRAFCPYSPRAGSQPHRGRSPSGADPCAGRPGTTENLAHTRVARLGCHSSRELAGVTKRRRPPRAGWAGARPRTPGSGRASWFRNPGGGPAGARECRGQHRRLPQSVPPSSTDRSLASANRRR